MCWFGVVKIVGGFLMECCVCGMLKSNCGLLLFWVKFG